MDGVQGVLCHACTSALHGDSRIGDPAAWYATEPAKWQGGSFGLAHHSSYADFQQSKDQGCFVCSWLWMKHAAPSKLSSASPAPTAGFRIVCRVQDYVAAFQVPGSSRVDRYMMDAIYCIVCSWSADVVLRVFLAREPKENTFTVTPPPPSLPWRDLETKPWSTLRPPSGSDEELQRIGKWIDNCGHNHRTCQRVTAVFGTFFPSRILDVGEAARGTVHLRTRDDVFLEHHSRQLQSSPLSSTPTPAQSSPWPVYWTLSHRWGDPSTILQLRSPVEQQFRDRGIPVTQLSPTFRDAALLVLRMGYRYLWIDSLCILQDSVADWNKEALAMADVYRHSFCNISATGPSADPAHLGLFHSGSTSTNSTGISYNSCPRLLYPFATSVTLRLDDGYEDSGPWMAWNDSLWEGEVEQASLSSRGWVVQERFLAPRIVHVSQTQMLWECPTGNVCMADPDDRFQLLGRHETLATRPSTFKEARAHLATVDDMLEYLDRRYGDSGTFAMAVECQEQWGAMVSLYSSCDLSHESDRLIAFAGIAKVFRETNNDNTYLAGLWQHFLHADLLWRSRACDGVPVRRSSSAVGTSPSSSSSSSSSSAWLNPRVPTWSWASVVGGVQLHVSRGLFIVVESQPLFQLVRTRIETEPPGGDPMGLLRSAELDVSCFLLYYRWRLHQQQPSGQGQNQLTVYTDEARSKVLCTEDDVAGNKAVQLDTADLIKQYTAVNVAEGVCMAVCTTEDSVHTRRQNRERLECLMLELDSPGRYRRVGVMILQKSLDQSWSGGRTCITLI